MKSVIEQATSIEKAIEKAWNHAGKPATFSVKIFEEPQKNFLGFTKKSAKVGIYFDEKDRTVVEERHEKNSSINVGRSHTVAHNAAAQEKRDDHPRRNSQRAPYKKRDTRSGHRPSQKSADERVRLERPQERSVHSQHTSKSDASQTAHAPAQDRPRSERSHDGQVPRQRSGVHQRPRRPFVKQDDASAPQTQVSDKAPEGSHISIAPKPREPHAPRDFKRPSHRSSSENTSSVSVAGQAPVAQTAPTSEHRNHHVSERRPLETKHVNAAEPKKEAVQQTVFELPIAGSGGVKKVLKSSGRCFSAKKPEQSVDAVVPAQDSKPSSEQ